MRIKLPNDTSLWASRLALYFSMYVVVIGSYLLFSRFDLWHTDVDSARYMLSSLIQSEAAIVALVVTLSLVAVQLAASSYSARVIDVLRRTPDLWILILIYGIVMFYGLGVLKLLEKADPQKCAENYICLSNLETHITLTYFLGVFAFLALVPYIWNTLQLLNPSTVIKMLSERITRESILNSIEGYTEERIDVLYGKVQASGVRVNIEKDPVQPIIDIICNSLMKYDYATLRDCVRAISNQTEYIFRNEKPEKMERKKILNHLTSHLTNVGVMAASKQDEFSTKIVIANLQKNGEIAVKEKLKYALEPVILSLRAIGILSAEQKLSSATQNVSFSLGDIGIIAIKEKELVYETRLVTVSLRDVGIAAASQKLDSAICNITLSLRDFGLAAAERELLETTKEVAGALEMVRDEALENGLKRASQWASDFLEKIDEAVSKLEK
nr:MAG: DUF2254 domain-containing protein [Candidatus Methanoperedens sp.]